MNVRREQANQVNIVGIQVLEAVFKVFLHKRAMMLMARLP